MQFAKENRKNFIFAFSINTTILLILLLILLILLYIIIYNKVQ